MTNKLKTDSLPVLYIQVMQCFPMVHHGISHESLVSSKSFVCITKKYKHLYAWYTTRERCITISYHAIKYTVANVGRNNNGALGVIPSSVQQLSCILIGCIFYVMV